MPRLTAEQVHKLIQHAAQERAEMLLDFYTFVKKAWPQIDGGRHIQDGWALRALCEHLEEVYYGRIRQLLINIMPRTGKSSICSVLFPVWVWLNKPSEQFMCISYSEKLSMRDNVKARRLIKSPWFQQQFAGLIHLSEDQDTKIRVDNMEGGYRVATSVDGTVLGEGFSIGICDDINAPGNASEALFESAKSFFTGVLPTRFNDFKTGRLINIQQRLDERDISGYILANEADDWVKLILPTEFEGERRCKTVPLKSTNGKPWQDPRTKEGELLWPERIGPLELKRLKLKLGSEYTIAGQLQQRPSPAEGGKIKKRWFKIWQGRETPQVEFVLQSWDTALTKTATSAYTAVSNWGVFKDEHEIPNLILLSWFRKKMEFPELYECVLRMSKDYMAWESGAKIKTKEREPDLVLIEDKASGITLTQQLRKSGATPVKFNPNKYGDKMNRVLRITHIIEAGRVWVMGQEPDFKKPRLSAQQFIEHCAMFPNADSRDVVDAFAQALLYLTMQGWVYHPSDEESMKPKSDKVERRALY